MTTDDTLTITDRLIEAVRATPGAGSGWIAKAIGSDDIHTCAALPDVLRRARDLALPANLVVIPRRVATRHEPESGPWCVMRRVDGRLVFVGERPTPEAVFALVRRAAKTTTGASS